MPHLYRFFIRTSFVSAYASRQLLQKRWKTLPEEAEENKETHPESCRMAEKAKTKPTQSKQAANRQDDYRVVRVGLAIDLVTFLRSSFVNFRSQVFLFL